MTEQDSTRPDDGPGTTLREPRTAREDRLATATENDGIAVWRPSELRPLDAATGGMRSRWIIPPVDGGGDYSVSEWSLTGAGWSDRHPHDELNYVIEGELHIESGGTTVVLRPGDAALVAKGETGRYWAPEYARMFAVYGSNPEGETSDYLDYWDIAEATGR
ncbi:cupin domain-containing protein [Streptomyces brevispora]|uniref:Cupin domain-containing protein n=1 Tax=Streptomyces brevispora TaxID=887462 RepID=A0ABZ1G0R4_9ACTN|nr:cupin domain-containing protein [Streptomyces brevispora]WSC12868.1 cupin domain-containing protein [Streptomyces brevispora]